MYTNEQQTYTRDEQTTKTTFLLHALERAYEGMTEGSVGAITYHIQSVHKDTSNGTWSTTAEYVVIDSGDRLESGLLTVRYGDSRVSMTDCDGPHIFLEWFKDTHASWPMIELMLAVDPRAVGWTIVDVIDQIWVDDGLDETDILDWYKDVCLAELYSDITDQEAQDLEDTQE